MGVVLALGTLDTALTILDCGMRISDWRKNERRTFTLLNCLTGKVY
jgi:hypothetical protein